MKLVLLGTKAGPRITTERMGPSQLVVTDDVTVLVDCAEGVCHQLLRGGFDPAGIDGLLITHHHSDHNAAYGNVIMAGWANGRAASIATYGPPPIVDMTDAVFEQHRVDIDTRVADEGRPDIRDLVVCREISGQGQVARMPGLVISATTVEHPPIHPALAYRFDHNGSSVVISGDTAPCSSLVELAHGADVLVHEVANLDWVGHRTGNFDAELMRQHQLRSHTPANTVGSVAAAAGVRKLVLSHLIPSSADIEDHHWVDLARETFDGEIVVGRDLMTIDI